MVNTQTNSDLAPNQFLMDGCVHTWLEGYEGLLSYIDYPYSACVSLYYKQLIIDASVRKHEDHVTDTMGTCYPSLAALAEIRKQDRFYRYLIQDVDDYNASYGWSQCWQEHPQINWDEWHEEKNKLRHLEQIARAFVSTTYQDELVQCYAIKRVKPSHYRITVERSLPQSAQSEIEIREKNGVMTVREVSVRRGHRK